MKRIVLLLAAGLLSVTIMACGKETEGAHKDISENNESRSEEASLGTQTEVMEEAGQEEAAATTEEKQKNKYQVGNVDNFSVNSKIVAAFGEEVKSVVADKDFEALADLAAFPLYIGFTDGGVSVETREDFIALGEDKIFTQELIDAIAAADVDSLSVSRAGFSLTDTGAPNIVFGVREGRLAIQGINY